MTGPVVRVGVTVQLDRVQKLLKETAHRAADLSLPFRGPVDALLTSFFERQFATQGAAGGEPWAPPSAMTQKLRKRSGHGHEGPNVSLRDTNVLWGGYTKSGGPDSIRVIERQSYARGTSVDYAADHQEPRLVGSLFGRPFRNPKSVPARRVVPKEMPKDVVGGIEDAIVNHLERDSGQ